jgi:hypothetical protein
MQMGVSQRAETLCAVLEDSIHHSALLRGGGRLRSCADLAALAVAAPLTVTDLSVRAGPSTGVASSDQAWTNPAR